MSRYYPIFYFYSTDPQIDPSERIRWYADSRHQARVAAAKLDWLDAHMPGDYQVGWASVPHSQRQGSTPELDETIRSMYGRNDPYAYVVWVEITTLLDQWLYEDGTKAIY